MMQFGIATAADAIANLQAKGHEDLFTTIYVDVDCQDG